MSLSRIESTDALSTLTKLTGTKEAQTASMPPPVVTLSNLYCQDIPKAFIFSEHPSTFQDGTKLLNDKKYLVHDYPPVLSMEILRAIRMCTVTGNDLPLLLRNIPEPIHKEHWKKWLPWFPDADIRHLETQDTGNEKLIMLYPVESIPAEKHVIDPDIHFHLHNKATIIKMGAMCPKHMSQKSFTVPCMIKATHGVSGKGTYMAKTTEDAEKILYQMHKYFKCLDPVITEVITDLIGNYCLQVYLFRSGDIQWIGVTSQIMSGGCHWGGGVVDWDEQENLKKMLYETAKPVIDYLHNKGYFGVVGMDILKNKDGQYVIDVNPRINGSTQHLLIAPHMAHVGLTHSRFITDQTFNCKMKHLIEETNLSNSKGKGKVIIQSAVDMPVGCEAQISIFGSPQYSPTDVYDQLVSEGNLGLSVT